MKARTLSLVGTALLMLAGPCLTVGCGYSEDEWQAQLAKYQKVNQEKAELQRQLEEAQTRTKDLDDKLAAMGIKLDQEGTQKAKMAAEVQDMRKALEEYKQRAAMLERIRSRFDLLRQKLRKMTELGLKVAIKDNRMVILLPGDVLFKAGEDALSKQGEELLMKVAEAIGSDSSLSQRHYQVAGHTDNEPLRRTAEKFRDNWGLSAMRARQVLVYLVSPTDKAGGGGGLDRTHWSAAGYGDTAPVAPNDTPEGREKNRRVELVLVPAMEEMLDLQSLAGK